MKKSSALVVLSGGQDSTTCLFWAKRNFDEVHAVTYDYGQKHRIELLAAAKVAEMAGISHNHEIVKVGSILRGSSPLVNRDQELDQYADMNSLPGGLEKTFVPGRNMLFATLAANHAYSLGITSLVLGVCQEDFGGYPDCRQVFIDAVERSIQLGFGYDDNDPFSSFMLYTPLMDLSKAESVLMAHKDELCWKALAYTHTSYDGAYPPVGKDHATLLREKGFYEAGLPDPLVLRAVREGLMALPETSNYNNHR